MTRHQTISFVKSGVRIAGYLALFHLPLAITLLVVSEIIGVVEEIGEK